ncbi:MAG: nitrate ABC transporter substrate-binding protein, partial [Marinobacter sp.]|nr:nitrate ABC transporter substrate-binding protein [Marinobacter sp.]
MTTKSLGNPFDGDQSLIHAKTCACPECKTGQDAPSVSLNLKPAARQDATEGAMDSEAMMDRAIESAVVRSVFGHNDHSRRSFM